jgi:flagellar protein FlaF
MSSTAFRHASKVYAKTSVETAAPRELEASLLLRAAAQLQSVLDSWSNKPTGLDEAVLYNRRLWIVFIDSVMQEENRLPAAVRQNIMNLGVFVLSETFSLMTAPKPEHLANIIAINRRIAAGLRGKSERDSKRSAA